LNREYSNLIELFSIGKSVENRNIWCVKITNKQNTSPKNNCVIDGSIHGNEWESTELCLDLAEYLVINFRRNDSVFLNS
jgi:murein tripeptide amidase MpaA